MAAIIPSLHSQFHRPSSKYHCRSYSPLKKQEHQKDRTRNYDLTLEELVGLSMKFYGPLRTRGEEIRKQTEGKLILWEHVELLEATIALGIEKFNIRLLQGQAHIVSTFFPRGINLQRRVLETLVEF
jgi:hypothetical protein